MKQARIIIRAVLLGSIATGALDAAPALAQAAAAPAAASTADEGNGIVVTARRREETLKDVPIAVTAYSAAALDRAGATDITDIEHTTPNITLQASRATNSTLTAFIRGVGQQDPVAGFEQGVGIYLDDVYLNRPQAAVLDIYDVERIEVLRGPQGTLYGRNTVGGAVKYVTKKLADVATVSARATYGSFNQADGVLSASTPVTSDGHRRFGRAAVARWLRQEPHHRARQLQQGYLGGAALGRDPRHQLLRAARRRLHAR
jgi:iron complex outermembrane receptor protein